MSGDLDQGRREIIVSERERTSETGKGTRPKPRIPKAPFADISAEERFYSRSLKIRLAVMECLAKLAQHESPLSQPVWDSFEDLAGYCANYVFTSRWDSKPASIVTCARWCKQFFLSNGLFKTLAVGSGAFSVSFRSAASRPAIFSLLKQYRPGRRKAENSQPRAADPPTQV